MFFCFSHLIFFFFSYSLFSLCRSVVLLPCLVIGSAFEKKKKKKKNFEVYQNLISRQSSKTVPSLMLVSKSARFFHLFPGLEGIEKVETLAPPKQ